MTPKTIEHDFLAVTKDLFEKVDTLSRNVTNINKKIVVIYKRLKLLEGER